MASILRRGRIPVPPTGLSEYIDQVYSIRGFFGPWAHLYRQHNSGHVTAASDPALRRRSIEALRDELDRAESLGLDALVMHPGSYTSGTEGGGLRQIADALAEVLESRLDARLRQKHYAVPAPLGGDLRQEQSAAPALLDDEPVAADLERVFVERIDGFEWTENRDLDVQIVEL